MAVNPFTTIVSYDDLQDKDILNELITSCNERLMALNTAWEPYLMAEAVAGDDPTGINGPVAEIQSWIMNTLYGAYYDYEDTVEDDHFIDSFTEQLFLERADIAYKDGAYKWFRRVPAGNARPADWTSTTDASFEYGAMQVGDIFGPWLYVDLQKCFKALRWTVRGSDGSVEGISRAKQWARNDDNEQGLLDISCTLLEHTDYWDDQTPEGEENILYLVLSTIVWADGDDEGHLYSDREYCAGATQDVYTEVQYRWSFFAKSYTPAYEGDYYPENYRDLDGFGVPASPLYWMLLEHDDSLSSEDTIISDDWLPTATSCPTTQALIDEVKAGGYAGQEFGVALYLGRFLMKWQFTYGTVSA